MSADHDGVERSEPASPRWIAQARELGQWPRSNELTTASALLAALLVLQAVGPVLAETLRDTLRNGLCETSLTRAELDRAVAGSWIRGRAIVLIPLLIAPGLAAAVVGLAQVGIRFRTDLLAPSLARFQPASGTWQFVSGTSVRIAVLSAAKWCGLCTCVLWWMWRELTAVKPLESAAAAPIARLAGAPLRLAIPLLCVMVGMGMADYAWAWVTHLSQMRMSRAELQAEARETDGDPVIRRRRKQKWVNQSRGAIRSARSSRREDQDPEPANAA
jgi:flagellar biosynthetic protein FlhB